jgi:hypothetical protein
MYLCACLTTADGQLRAPAAEMREREREREREMTERDCHREHQGCLMNEENTCPLWMGL